MCTRWSRFESQLLRGGGRCTSIVRVAETFKQKKKEIPNKNSELTTGNEMVSVNVAITALALLIALITVERALIGDPIILSQSNASKFDLIHLISVLFNCDFFFFFQLLLLLLAGKKSESCR